MTSPTMEALLWAALVWNTLATLYFTRKWIQSVRGAKNMTGGPHSHANQVRRMVAEAKAGTETHCFHCEEPTVKQVQKCGTRGRWCRVCTHCGWHQKLSAGLSKKLEEQQ